MKQNVHLALLLLFVIVASSTQNLFGIDSFNLTPGLNQPGWDAPVVARNTPDATDSTCVIPDSLQGNANNYFNTTWTNSGTDIVPAGFIVQVTVDNQALYNLNSPSVSPFVFINDLNNGPWTNIRGGRHTLLLKVDATNLVTESDESDNSYSEQFVWSPLLVTPATPLNRSAPPDKGIGIYPNCDGFSVSPPASMGSAVAILSTSANADYDLSLYRDYTGTHAGFSVLLGTSTYGSNAPDYIIVPWRLSTEGFTYFPAIINYNSAGSNVVIEAENTVNRVTGDPFWSTLAPDTLASGSIFNMYEFLLHSGINYRILCDMISGSANVGLRLFRDSTFIVSRVNALAIANSSGGGGDEFLLYTPAVSDWYILIVEKTSSVSTNGTAIYNLYSGPHVPSFPVGNLVIQYVSELLCTRLDWNQVTQDSLGLPLTDVRYVIYRGKDPYFNPEPSDSIGGTSDSTYFDYNALNYDKFFYKITVKSK